MILPQSVMIGSEGINFSLSVIVGVEESAKGVPELGIEVVAGIKSGSHVVVHRVY